ncbi:MAG: hypothetical protein ACTSP4_00505 [Candidatus Hodarchaeales archaeon]
MSLNPEQEQDQGNNETVYGKAPQKTGTLEPIAPMMAPENIDNPFVAAYEHNVSKYPLHTMLSQEFVKGATDFYGYLKTSRAKANDLGEKIANSTALNSVPWLKNHLNESIVDLPIKGYLSKYFDSSPPKELTAEEYKASPWNRPDIKYPNGVTEDLAKLSAQNEDEEALFEDEQQHTSHSPFSITLQAASSLTGSLFNPMNLALNAVTDGEYATGQLSKLLPLIRDNAMAARFARGAVEGGSFGVSAGSLDYLNQKALGQSPDPWQILYSGLTGSALGSAGAAFIPKLASTFGKTVLQSEIGKAVFEHPLAKKYNIDKIFGYQEAYTPIKPEHHDALMEAASGQLENDIVPNLSEFTQQALYEQKENLLNKIKDDSGINEDQAELLKVQKDGMDNAISKIDERLKTEKDEDEIEKLKSDRDALSRQSDLHENLINFKSDKIDPVTREQLQAKSNFLRTPEADVNYNLGDEEGLRDVDDAINDLEMKPSQDEIEGANAVNDAYDNFKKDLPAGEKAKFDKIAKSATDDLDAREKLFNGIKNCIGVE